MAIQAISFAESVPQRHEAEPAFRSAPMTALAGSHPRGVALRQIADTLNESPRVADQAKLTLAMHASPGMMAQRRLIDAMAAKPGQLQDLDDDELLQGRFETVQLIEPETNSVPRRNDTGLPDQLKAGIESLSGMSLDNVRVHYNSPQPAQLNALAYAQGSDIHVAAGQEQHLPHEAWHVVQQAQGRVQPTMQMMDVPINDDKDLEDEADEMGARAERLASGSVGQFKQAPRHALANQPVQRQVPAGGETSKPTASTGSYEARGGQDIIFNSDNHPRSKFSFGTKTRNEVFSRYNPQYVGNRIISIRSSHGEQVNVEGIQLDHQVSWDRIAEAMTSHNRAMRANNVTDKNQYYTLWDAKMYYNDQSNLVPALGALNASGGSAGVGEMPRIHYGLESVQGTLQTSWMNLQAGLVAVGGGMSDDAVEEVATLMLQIGRAMNDVTERLL